ncbi:Elongation of very long chain fatty acids protein [Temnothorax longispinosus]|uniref:Elongation of very long chain fatty acids protein n=1 Tax=Temnothorax longispinosus TaxID=300112 RepID=A0A4S2JI75_9HYME|nr:Elongation of very long chain fatty acids protein [Temnothorax longispinosus]
MAYSLRPRVQNVILAHTCLRKSYWHVLTSDFLVNKTSSKWLVSYNYNEVLRNVRSPMLCIVGAYLIFVLKVGPKMMEKRPAFQLNTVMILYNAFQVLFSTIWLTGLTLNVDIKYLFSAHGCDTQDYISPPENVRMASSFNHKSTYAQYHGKDKSWTLKWDTIRRPACPNSKNNNNGSTRFLGKILIGETITKLPRHFYDVLINTVEKRQESRKSTGRNV